MRSGAVVLFLLFSTVAAQTTDNPSIDKCEELNEKLDSCLSNNELILKVFNETAKQLEKQCEENKEMMKKQAEKQEMEKKEMKMEMDKLKMENEKLKEKMKECEKEKEKEMMEKEKCEKEKKEKEESDKTTTPPPPPTTTSTTTTTTTTPPPPPPTTPPPAEEEDLTDVISELKKCEKKVADFITEKAEQMNMTTTSTTTTTTTTTTPKPPPETGMQMMNLSTGTYFFDKKQRYTWKDGESHCRSLGLQLATFETKHQLSSFWNAAPSTTWGPWTSGSFRGPHSEDFFWGNGLKISPDMWRLGQPDEFSIGKESCVYIYDGALYDEACSEKNHVICEQRQQQQFQPFFTFG